MRMPAFGTWDHEDHHFFPGDQEKSICFPDLDYLSSRRMLASRESVGANGSLIGP
jgi:hypothetical protein